MHNTYQCNDYYYFYWNAVGILNDALRIPRVHDWYHLHKTQNWMNHFAARINEWIIICNQYFYSINIMHTSVATVFSYKVHNSSLHRYPIFCSSLD